VGQRLSICWRAIIQLLSSPPRPRLTQIHIPPPPHTHTHLRVTYDTHNLLQVQKQCRTTSLWALGNLASSKAIAMDMWENAELWKTLTTNAGSDCSQSRAYTMRVLLHLAESGPEVAALMWEDLDVRHAIVDCIALVVAPDHRMCREFALVTLAELAKTDAKKEEIWSEHGVKDALVAVGELEGDPDRKSRLSALIVLLNLASAHVNARLMWRDDRVQSVIIAGALLRSHADRQCCATALWALGNLADEDDNKALMWDNLGVQNALTTASKLSGSDPADRACKENGLWALAVLAENDMTAVRMHGERKVLDTLVASSMLHHFTERDSRAYVTAYLVL
jgi:hypothetical protein